MDHNESEDVAFRSKQVKATASLCKDILHISNTPICCAHQQSYPNAISD